LYETIILQNNPICSDNSGKNENKLTTEAMAHRKNNNENQCNYDSKNYELDLHVLIPHLSPQLGSLLPEILCLHSHTISIDIPIIHNLMEKLSSIKQSFSLDNK